MVNFCNQLPYNGITRFTFNPSIKRKSIKRKFNDFIDWFNRSMIEIKGRPGKYKALKGIQMSFQARLQEGYVAQDFYNALQAISQDSYHRETAFKYLTPEYLVRSKVLEKWCNVEVSTGNSNNYVPTAGNEQPKLKTWGKKKN